ncbi:MAG: putative spermidine synthase with an N-terminal membrane domain [Elusimicrobia bacterium]|nr:MAG: putative spermidine synthase with an N-terminal membrane domain [Elusimicrobiota bacterium]KAF0152334.1 MAG: putative spermidine synthase with an N-terminal membrane domain [Elusimicrobiota bacterium]
MGKFFSAVPDLRLLFFLSGISGLVFQTVWFRMLIRVFGGTMEAAGTVLAVFMGGLAIGAILAGRRADTIKEPLKAYALLELLIALSGAAATLLLAALPYLIGNWLPPAFLEGGWAPLTRILVSAAVLLPPTVLMGATLPLLVKAAAPSAAASGRAISVLYALNTLGASAGVLLAGFILIAWLGERGTAAFAALLNIGIALRAYFAAMPPALSPGDAEPAPSPARRGGYGLMLAALAFAGFSALALEVLWARMLVVMLGNSVYAFSAMLGVYLLGSALGSLAAGRRRVLAADPLPLLARAQAALAAVAAAGTLLFFFAGRNTLDPKYLYSPLSSAYDLAWIFGWTFLIIFPATLVMGFFFPLAARAGVEWSRRLGSVGALYGANTAGAVAGSLAAGFVMIPELGTKFSFVLVSLLAAAAGLLLILASGREKLPAFAPWLAAAVMIPFSLFALPDPAYTIITSRIRANSVGDVAYYREDRGGTVTVVLADGGRIRMLFINGLIVSGTGAAGSLMTHFPLLFQEGPREVLVIGLGAGGAARSGLSHGAAVTVAEILPAVADAAPFLISDWDEMSGDPRFRLVLNDGRNELLRQRAAYDAIIVDVTPPVYSAGAVNVYSRDFFGLAGRRLSPSGMVSVWIPTPCFETDRCAILRAMADVFPFLEVWAFPAQPGFLALGAFQAPEMSPGAVSRGLKKGNIAEELPTLSTELLLARRLGPEEKEKAMSGCRSVTDDRPATEFPLMKLLRAEPVLR